jgi:2-haloacid dehalogenase
VQLDTLLFNVFGTGVDVNGSARDAAVAALGPAGAALGDDWGRRHGALVEDVASGRAPWRPNTSLRAAASRTRPRPRSSAAAPDAFAALAAVDARLRPWPDSSAALQALSGSFTVVALSDGTLAELTALSRAGGLLWHALLSAELVEAYKLRSGRLPGSRWNGSRSSRSER